MPEADFALIALLKGRALELQRTVKKSELLRAGLHALSALEPKAFVDAIGKLEPVKTGRPDVLATVYRKHGKSLIAQASCDLPRGRKL